MKQSSQVSPTFSIRFLIAWLFMGLVGGLILSWEVLPGVRVSLLDASVLSVVFYAIVARHKIREAIQFNTPVFGPFILAVLLSLLLQVRQFTYAELGVSSLYFIRFMVYGQLLFVFRDLTFKKYGLILLNRAGLTIAILGVFQYFLYPNLRNLFYLGWDPHQFRLFSTYLDPNFTGLLLVLTIFADFYIKRSVPLISLARIPSGILAASLLMTYSRGSLIAFVVASTLGFILLRKYKFILIIALLVALVFLLPKRSGEGANILRTSTLMLRLADTRQALSVIAKFPLTGTGFNTLRFVKQETYIVEGTISVAHSGAGFHNGWLFLWATTGVVGVGTYLHIYIVSLKSLITRIRKEKSLSPLAVLIISSLSAVFIHSFFDNSLFYPAVMFWIWVLLAQVSG